MFQIYTIVKIKKNWIHIKPIKTQKQKLINKLICSVMLNKKNKRPSGMLFYKLTHTETGQLFLYHPSKLMAWYLPPCSN